MILLVVVGAALCSLAGVSGIEIESPFACSVKGQILHQCRPCPFTCTNYKQITCRFPCTPGCGCPEGQVIDTDNNRCVHPKLCPLNCGLFRCDAIIDCEALGKKSVTLPGQCCPSCVDSCANHKCPTGSRCKVYQPTGGAFCEPSCDLDNGGCPANQDCSLVPRICPGPPCPPLVKCTPPIHTVCRVGDKVYQVGETFKQGCSDCICVTTGQTLCGIHNCDAIGPTLNR